MDHQKKELTVFCYVVTPRLVLFVLIFFTVAYLLGNWNVLPLSIGSLKKGEG